VASQLRFYDNILQIMYRFKKTNGVRPCLLTFVFIKNELTFRNKFFILFSGKGHTRAKSNMVRSLRIEYPGAVYHITSRGNKQESIYLSDEDRQFFLDLLSQVCYRCQWICYAYCLMDNHYHLFIETPRGNISKGMQLLNGIYTQKFNRSHQRVGHVFQGRFKGILVQKESYFLELSRYIVLNPVRANMVQYTNDWRWSSYHETTTSTACPNWLAAESILSCFI